MPELLRGTGYDAVRNRNATPFDSPIKILTNLQTVSLSPSETSPYADLFTQLQRGRGKTIFSPIMFRDAAEYSDAFFNDKSYNWSLNACTVFHEVTHAMVGKFIPTLPSFMWTSDGLRAGAFWSIRTKVAAKESSYPTQFDKVVINALMQGQPTGTIPIQFNRILSILKTYPVLSQTDAVAIAQAEFDRRELQCDHVTVNDESKDTTYQLTAARATVANLTTQPSLMVFYRRTRDWGSELTGGSSKIQCWRTTAGSSSARIKRRTDLSWVSAEYSNDTKRGALTLKWWTPKNFSLVAVWFARQVAATMVMASTALVYYGWHRYWMFVQAGVGALMALRGHEEKIADNDEETDDNSTPVDVSLKEKVVVEEEVNGASEPDSLSPGTATSVTGSDVITAIAPQGSMLETGSSGIDPIWRNLQTRNVEVAPGNNTLENTVKTEPAPQVQAAEVSVTIEEATNTLRHFDDNTLRILRPNPSSNAHYPPFEVVEGLNPSHRRLCRPFRIIGLCKPVWLRVSRPDRLSSRIVVDARLVSRTKEVLSAADSGATASGFVTDDAEEDTKSTLKRLAGADDPAYGSVDCTGFKNVDPGPVAPNT
ncbi:hypothetical protein BJ742DRAFT_769335 [Cladochytrium replicatum]|nr:hypothetical protein BJ742DRAFT_769335 [Cladochytrium replicatum]